MFSLPKESFRLQKLEKSLFHGSDGNGRPLFGLEACFQFEPMMANNR